MKITSLHLHQFRSYGDLQLDCADHDVHLLVGPNGAGKTNIVEAMTVLSLTKSCHGVEELDMMQWDTEFYRVRAETLADDGVTGSLEVASQLVPRKKKACFRNDVAVSIGDMVGALPTVVFLPQDLDLFRGAPQRRRQWLDQLLCQVFPEYVGQSSQYAKLLKQRNALLRKIADGQAQVDHLELWDEQLASSAVQLTSQRLALIEVLQCTLAQELQSLGEAWDEVQLVYERKGTETEPQAMQQELKTMLCDNRQRDVILQSTTVGPHREDWRLDVAGRSLPSFASRGQQRTAVLALLFLQVSYLELRRGERAVILLDDVFSELDDNHQSALLRSLKDHQVFITTTHVPTDIHGAKVWRVADATVKQCDNEAIKQ